MASSARDVETLSPADEVALRRLRHRVASHVVWSISPTWREFVCSVSCSGANTKLTALPTRPATLVYGFTAVDIYCLGFAMPRALSIARGKPSLPKMLVEPGGGGGGTYLFFSRSSSLFRFFSAFSSSVSLSQGKRKS